MRLTDAYLLTAAIFVALMNTMAITAAEENRWRKLPPLPGRADYAPSIAVEGGKLWAMAGSTVAYWDGRQWQLPAGPKLHAGMYLTKFKGGGDRPLYVTQSGQREQSGEIYQLIGTEARLVTEFHYEAAHEHPGIYVSRSGKIFNFSKRRLAVYDGAGWVQRDVPESAPVIIEAQESVHFYYSAAKTVIEIDRQNHFQNREVPIEFAESQPKVVGVLWGDDRALLFEYERPGLQGFRLADGRPIDVREVKEKIGSATIYDAFGTRDGSAWILTGTFDLSRVYPDGTVEAIEDLVGVDWTGYQFRYYPQSVLEAESGSLWFGGMGHPVTCYEQSAVRRFGFRTGYDLTGCTHLVEDRHGTIYAANWAGIYAYFAATAPPTDLSPPREPTLLGQPTWIHQPADQPSPTAAWKVGPRIFIVSRSDQSLAAIDAASGRLIYRRELDTEQPFSMPWMVGNNDEHILQVATHTGIARVRASDGEIIQRVPFRHDSRIAPAPVAAGVLAVPADEAGQFACISEQGNTLWKCELPGNVMMHPTVQGRYALLQTRGSSYGGQRTVCVDTGTGDLLWSDLTDAYGCGAAFDGNSRFVVEANMSLSPEKSEGWLIGRHLPDGNRQWEYRQPGLIHHPPMMDEEHGRVFAVFARGKVVCLRSHDGSLVWQQTLPEFAFEDGSANPYESAWSPHTLDGDRLLVLDRNLVLHFLNAQTGEFLASVALQDDRRVAPYKNTALVAPPWTTDDAIIATFADRIVGYALPDELHRYGPPIQPAELARTSQPNPHCATNTIRARFNCRGGLLLGRSRESRRRRFWQFQSRSR